MVLDALECLATPWFTPPRGLKPPGRTAELPGHLQLDAWQAEATVFPACFSVTRVTTGTVPAPVFSVPGLRENQVF